MSSVDRKGSGVSWKNVGTLIVTEILWLLSWFKIDLIFYVLSPIFNSIFETGKLFIL